MKTLKYDLDCGGKPIQILPLSDLHIGDGHCDYKLINDSIKQIAETENMFTILDGDCMNTAIISSKSDIYQETMTPMEELQKCVEIFQPLADNGKILAILTGNHEERISRSVGVNLTEVMAKQLGIHERYSPTSTLIFLRFGQPKAKNDRQIVYSIYVNHGNGGGGKRAGSKVNALEDMSRIITADIYLMGHTHQPASFRKAHYVTNPGNRTVSLREQLFVNTASMLNWDGSYGDRAGFQPNSKQFPIITLSNEKHEARVVI